MNYYYGSCEQWSEGCYPLNKYLCFCGETQPISLSFNFNAPLKKNPAGGKCFYLTFAEN
uniref:Uncharacterized protein n=1 Tax=Rhizophora mucronata TaxID=61149 RepID=A0A2P2QK17_RHIMU